MATLQFTYETGAVPLSKIVDAFAWRFNYDANKQGAETQSQFARRMLARQIIGVVKDHEAYLATTAIPPINEIDLT